MKVKNLDQLQKLSISVAERLNTEDCIFLFGEIGVGKTTFVRYLINYLQKKNDLKENHVLSPTFNVVYEYEIKDFKIMHYDLFRIKSTKDIEELGIFENYKKCIILIEWPQLITAKTIDKIEMYFKYSDNLNTRHVHIKSFGRCNDYKFEKF